MEFRASLEHADKEIFDLIQVETRRQNEGLEMIPSENFVGEAILEANGSILTNKYAEGLPGKRYYGGCENYDKIEQIAIDRAKALFGAEFANVQPHSGATANQAVYEATVNPGDTVMGMALDHGGHLTHGLKVNFSGRHYNIVPYGVREDNHLIDEDQIMELAKKHRPKLITCGASAYPRKINFGAFRRAADEVGAVVLADIAHYAGLVAAGVYPSPIEHCEFVTTTTHKTLRGPRSGLIMAKKEFGKAVNKAVFPGLQGGPHMHTIAAKAVSFKLAAGDDFKIYARRIVDNAQTLATHLIEQGFTLVSGGTDSHLLLIDLRSVDITGKEAEQVLGEVGITLNRNTIPFDPQPPTICSGIRFGTPALTTRGMGAAEMQFVARVMKEALQARGNSAKLSSLADEVRELTKKFPLYEHRVR